MASLGAECAPRPAQVESLLLALERLSADMEALVSGAMSIRSAALSGDVARLAEGCRWTEEQAKALSRHEEERATIARTLVAASPGTLEPTLDELASALPRPDAERLRSAGAAVAERARTLRSLQSHNATLLRTAAEIAGSTARWLASTVDAPRGYGPSAIDGGSAQGKLLDWQV